MRRSTHPWPALLCLLLAACGQQAQRDYQRTLYDAQHRPVLRATVHYLGKTPPPDARISDTAREHDTDYYSTTLQNLSDRPVALLAIRYAMARGPLYSPTVKDRQAIAEDYGATLMEPGESIEDADSYVWAKERDNRLQRTFELTVAGQPLSLQLPLDYHR